MAETRALDGPIGLVGAGYNGHLFAQHFALAGHEVRAWSPGGSAGTLQDRLRQSLSTLAEIGAVESSQIDVVLARVSTHDDLAEALAPCAAVMESIVEDAEVKSACYRDIEAVVGPEVLLWSATSSLPMTRLAAGMAPPRASHRPPSRADAADHLPRGRARGADRRADGRDHHGLLRRGWPAGDSRQQGWGDWGTARGPEGIEAAWRRWYAAFGRCPSDDHRPFEPLLNPPAAFVHSLRFDGRCQFPQPRRRDG